MKAISLKSMTKAPVIFDISSVLSSNDDMSMDSEMSELSNNTKMLLIAVGRINMLKGPLSTSFENLSKAIQVYDSS